MSVLITSDFETFDELANNYRLVIFDNTSKTEYAREKINAMKKANGMRIRKGNLRIFDCNTQFEQKDLYPTRFNNYHIVLAVNNNFTGFLGYLESVLSSLAEANKSATITIKGWDKILKRTAKFARPSEFRALFLKYNATVSDQTDANGTVAIKTLRV